MPVRSLRTFLLKASKSPCWRWTLQDASRCALSEMGEVRSFLWDLQNIAAKSGQTRRSHVHSLRTNYSCHLAWQVTGACLRTARGSRSAWRKNPWHRTQRGPRPGNWTRNFIASQWWRRGSPAHLFTFGSFAQVPLLLADLVVMPLRPNEKPWYELLAFGACGRSRPETIIYVFCFVFFLNVDSCFHLSLLLNHSVLVCWFWHLFISCQ